MTSFSTRIFFAASFYRNVSSDGHRGGRSGGRLCFRRQFGVHFADENGTAGIADNEVSSAFGDHMMMHVGILVALSDYDVSSSAFLCFFYDHLSGLSFAGNYGAAHLCASLYKIQKGNLRVDLG